MVYNQDEADAVIPQFVHNVGASRVEYDRYCHCQRPPGFLLSVSRTGYVSYPWLALFTRNLNSRKRSREMVGLHLLGDKSLRKLDKQLSNKTQGSLEGSSRKRLLLYNSKF